MNRRIGTLFFGVCSGQHGELTYEMHLAPDVERVIRPLLSGELDVVPILDDDGDIVGVMLAKEGLGHMAKRLTGG